MKPPVRRARQRRYLTGIDWIVAAMDRATRRSTGGSNASQIVIELDAPPDARRFSDGVAALAGRLPVVGGRPARAWNLAPYWRIPRRSADVPVESIRVEGTDEGPALTALANAPVGGRGSCLAFGLVTTADGRGFVAMRFDHRLFDAQGAELFLDLLRRKLDGEDVDDALAGISLSEPSHLNAWRRRYETGRLFMREVRALRSVAPVVFPRPTPLRGRAFRFRRMTFDADATAAIRARADREAGFLMFMPYVAAAAAGALHTVARGRALPGEEYVVSVSVGQRPLDAMQAEVFFNRLSFLLFRLPAGALDDRAALLGAIRGQMYEQVKSGFAAAAAESSMLMRIVPLSLFSRMLLWPMRGEFASFAFSCLQDGALSAERFTVHGVRNVVHMPLIPVPPGLGLVAHRFRDRMTATLCHLDGVLDEAEAATVEAEFRARLQGAAGRPEGEAHDAG